MAQPGTFDPNAAEPARKALLPSVPVELGGVAQSIDHYLFALHKAGEAIAGISKALTPPPQAFSYATISTMPDAVASGLMAWPGINPDSLRKVRRESILPDIIINQRKSDIRRYANLAAQPWTPGWRIDLLEAERSPSAADKRDILAAQKFLYNCSLDTAYADARERDAGLITPFSQFLAASVEDILTYDGWAVWTDMDRAGRVKRFTNLPAGLIRLARPGVGYRNDPAMFAALLDETGNPITGFTRDEMFWRVMNPRTDPEVAQYGWSFIEQGVRLIQAFQNAIDLNADVFTRNSIPNGIMLLKGDFWNQDQVDVLMREWNNAKKGITKAWGVPVVSVPDEGDVEILNMMDMKGQEVRYRDHMNMMVGAFCAVTSFPVRRLGLFASGHAADNEPVKGGSLDIAGVDDPGLPPLLQFIAEGINQYLLWPNWPHLHFRFTNTDPKTDAREYEARKLSRTWAESRAEADQKPLTDGVPEHLKPLMEVMSLCPEDPNKGAAFATLAAIVLNSIYGESDTAGDGQDEAPPGNRMTSKIDPARSIGHGHTSGVRRNSRAEKQSAGTKD
ncbi:MAG: hypothetical protein M0Z28_27470 [Rhodospirillales bacterium]|nr:hypothetical protein [Rhodospirillales bacterium]